MRTLYEILEVTETASDEVIRGAYKYLAQKWHPDKNSGHEDEARTKMGEINSAYQILSDARSRLDYDRSIFEERKQNHYANSSQNSASSGKNKPKTPPKETSEPQVGKQICPWVRYWARTLDVVFASIVSSIILAVFIPSFLDPKPSRDIDQLWGVLLVFFWIFGEAFFLSTIGTTPGKWLLRTHISPSTGTKFSLSSALQRSFYVWWRGMGVGFPIIALFAHLIAYNKLTKNGQTTWDRDLGSSVSHSPIGVWRIFAAMAIILIPILAVVMDAPSLG